MEKQKHFIYFEEIDAGLFVFDIYNESDLSKLYGWMSKDCQKQDEELVDWMKTAEVGTYKSHRLGYLVRLVDKFT